jgi:hypothetical protein
MDSKAWVARAMALALVVPVAAACNKEDNDANIEVQTETPPPAAPVTVTINPQGGAMLSGDLTATHEADKTTVRLSLAGLTEDKDYEAKIRYGDCTMAANYLKDDDMAATPGAATTPAAGTDSGASMSAAHDPGDKVADIDLDKTGATATGTADIDNDELGAGEAAYVVITQDDMLVGCADLSGHGDMGGMSAPGTAPGAAMPADSAHP